MTKHRDESLLDQAKDAVWPDTDESTSTDETSSDRPEGWAGVDAALEEDPVKSNEQDDR